MDNCYVCNNKINFKDGEWSPIIVKSLPYYKCDKCTDDQNYVLVIEINLKDIKAFKKILDGFSYHNYLRNNLIHIVYNFGISYELLLNLLSDIGMDEVNNEFIIINHEKYKKVISSFK